MNIQREKFSVGVPVWHHDKSLQVMVGGFTLDVGNIPTGIIIPDATPVLVDETSRTALVVKGAFVSKAVAAADTTVEIKKGSLLAVGDKVNGKEITEIDKTEATHDVLTLAAAYGKAIPANGGVSTGDGNGLLYGGDVKVTQGNTHHITVGVGGLVYARRIGFVSDKTKENLPNIIFSLNK